jgi:hypothetical protein
MTDRPYFSLGADELEGEARKHWDSPTVLATILAELKHRSTAKAQRLERDVADRIVTLGAKGDGPKGRTGGHAQRDAPPGSRDAQHERALRELTQRAVRAEQAARELQERLRAAEAEVTRARAAAEDPSSALYAQVGLHPSCPEFVVKVVQRAFRKEYHPDLLSDRPRGEQLAAQERFKAYEMVFDQIARTRG